MQILTRFWVTLLLFCVRFPAVSSDNPSSLVEYLEEYVPDETLRRLVDTGVEVRWKSIKAKTYSDDAVLKLSDDFATVKVAKKSDGKGPKIKLHKVKETYLGAALILDRKERKPNFASRSFTLYTGKRQSAGTDFLALNMESAKTTFKIIEGILSFLRKKPKPIELNVQAVKKYKDPDADLEHKKSFHAELRDEEKWLQEREDKLAKERKAEKRRLRKLRDQQARERDDGEYNLRRLMIKIDYAVRDGEDTLEIAKQLARACEKAKKSKTGWHETSTVYPNAVQRATEHGAPPYDEETELRKKREERLGRYQTAVVKLDKILAATGNLTHAERIGITRLFTNKTHKDVVIASMMEGVNVTMADILKSVAEHNAQPQPSTPVQKGDVAPDGKPATQNKIVKIKEEREHDGDGDTTKTTKVKGGSKSPSGTRTKDREKAKASGKQQTNLPNSTPMKTPDSSAAERRMQDEENTETKRTVGAECGSDTCANGVPQEQKEMDRKGSASTKEYAGPTKDSKPRKLAFQTRKPNVVDKKIKQTASNESSDQKNAAQQSQPDSEDPPPSKCAVKLFVAIQSAKTSSTVEQLESAIQSAGECADAAGDMEPW
eukprot:CAMPEP_0195509396 /NCGR_PEP_ID=MMETSP0794_2-20130614/2343_1 /TAXON_ID=515487 /ORGANISM="Stephanopyxis turris, Strain CCMP 815" /LENGTH=603 /DNA_ID=CAMNT_0040636601 /DNA_START=77 /DNA_END=1885 /DNA_ORIENTATION=-